MATFSWIIILSGILLSSQVNCQEAVLHISNGSVDKEYCLVYNSSWTNLSLTLAGATEYSLVNLSSSQLCTPAGIAPRTVHGKAVVVMRGECDFSQKALVAQDLGVATLIIVSTTAMHPPAANETEYEKVLIPIVLMRYMDFLDAQTVFGEEMQVRLYSPVVPMLDPSIVVMLLIGVVTVTLGAYWSGACERERLNGGQPGGGGGEGGEGGKSDSGDVILYSPLKVVIFVGLMCVMLVLMYFFSKYLVYVIIVIFCLASATALFSCLDALLDLARCSPMRVTVLGKGVSMRSVVLCCVCVTAAVIWGVYRNEDRWIWILQDLLGVAFCLNFLKTISLSNYKICVILLSLLLLYDVFFVFITPLFMNGESIMVQVALGPDAAGEKGNFGVPADPSTPHEKLPVVMRVPRLFPWSQNLCAMQFSILGYGDIIVPGLLVAYGSRFDVRVHSPNKIYLFVCCIAYLCGMVITFAVMLLTGMAQPALLYLVPCTLLGSAVLAWRRGEMRQFWSGTPYEVLDSTREPLLTGAPPDYASR